MISLTSLIANSTDIHSGKVDNSANIYELKFTIFSQAVVR